MENNVLLGAVNEAAQAVATEDLGGAFSPERWSYAGQMTLLGMVMVFAVLALLWLILAIFEKAMSKESVTSVEKPVSVPTPIVETPPVAVSSDDEVIAAVIAAAVAAYMAGEGNTESAYSGGFRVVSFRRVQGGKAWNSKY